MESTGQTYDRFFRSGQRVSVGIRLAGDLLLQEQAVVRCVEGNLMRLSLLGDTPSERPPALPGTDVSITSDAGYSFYRCSAVLAEPERGPFMQLLLTGSVKERQQREYFRFDVQLPLLLTSPPTQALVEVKQCWESRKRQFRGVPPVMLPWDGSYKVVRWEDSVEIFPEKVNLSGGGMRVHVARHAEPGSLKQVSLFLPVAPPRVVSVVAEVLRCHEITLLWRRGRCFVTAMRFLYIDETDRESIISYLFLEQRRELLALRERLPPLR
jgi:c-di-GMP-binding flagellar brake protein YcgR